MAEAFKHIGDMPAMDPSNGEVQEQSFQSSSRSAMGEDGKMHTIEKKAGDKVECHNGHCKQVRCENGKCQEREIDASHQQDPQEQQPNRSGYSARPANSQTGRNPDHRDVMKEMMKKMMDPSNQGSQSGSGDQPQIIEIDPSTEEGQAQLKEIMKLMKDPRHQIKQISGEKAGQMGMAKNGLSREGGMKMVGNQEKSSGTAEGSGRNYNPNAKPSAEDM